MARKTLKRKQKSQQPAQTQTPRTRRDVMRMSLIGGAGVLALGSGGAAGALDFRRKMAELDLSVIGNGTPAVVQIHDPTCPLCAPLQKQTRRAVRAFSEEDVNFRVASIASEEGSAFQGRQGLPHVTLALFDGSGTRVHVVSGVQSDVEALTSILSYHLDLPKK